MKRYHGALTRRSSEFESQVVHQKGSMRDVSKMPVMKGMCETCPFSENGSLEVRANVESRTLRGINQTCHHSGGLDKRDTHLCRGARDFQLRLFVALGFLSEPTDAAWDAKRKEIGA